VSRGPSGACPLPSIGESSPQFLVGGELVEKRLLYINYTWRS